MRHLITNSPLITQSAINSGKTETQFEYLKAMMRAGLIGNETQLYYITPRPLSRNLSDRLMDLQAAGGLNVHTIPDH